MRAHFFLVTSSTCATYLWFNMAAPAPVIISTLQLVGQKNNISIWKLHITSTQIPWSWQTWGWWVHRRAGECDPTEEHS